MSKQDVIDYVMHSPYNTNKAVLKGLLEDLGGNSFSEFKIPLEETEESVSINTSIANELLSAEEGELFELDGVNGIGMLTSFEGPFHMLNEEVEEDMYTLIFSIINSDDNIFGYVTCELTVTIQNNLLFGYGFEIFRNTSSDLPISGTIVEDGPPIITISEQS